MNDNEKRSYYLPWHRDQADQKRRYKNKLPYTVKLSIVVFWFALIVIFA